MYIDSAGLLSAQITMMSRIAVRRKAFQRDKRHSNLAEIADRCVALIANPLGVTNQLNMIVHI